MKLSQACEFIVDCEHKTAPLSDVGYPSIRTPNIGKGFLILDNVNRVSEKIYQLWTKRAVPQKDDLILAREAPVGNVAIIPDNIKVCLGQRTVLIRPSKTIVNPRYLNYLLLGNEVQNLIQSLCNGSTVHHLNVQDIRNLEIGNIVSLEEQAKIAKILSNYDDLIENNNKRIKILEEMAQKIYKEWFVDFRFPGHETATFKQTDLGSEVMPIKGKNITKAIIKKGNVPVVAGGIEPAYYHNIPNTVAPVITVSASGANAGYINLYYQDIWASDCSYIDTTMTPYVYYYYLLLKYNQIKVTNMQRGAAQPHVYPKDLAQLKIKIPEENVIREFNEIITPFFSEISNFSLKNQTLKQTRDLLLPRLISSEIDVENMEIK